MTAQFLPTVAAARAVDPDLPEGAPEERALAAVTLAALIHRRDAHVQRIEIAAPRVDKLRRSPPPAPRPFLPATHAVLAAVVEQRACTACGVRPGFLPCPFCNLARCEECHNMGWVLCTTCDGARQIALADVRMIEDREVDFRLTFTPTLPSYAFEQWLRETIDDAVDGPDSLFFDIERSSAFAPYREVEREDDDAFHGHRFEDALARARNGVSRLREGEVFSEQLRAWARPFLLLAWPEVSAIVLADGLGGVRVFRA